MQFLRKTQRGESRVKDRQEPREAGREGAPGAPAAPPTQTPAPSAWPWPLPRGAPAAGPPALRPGPVSRVRGGKLSSPLDKGESVAGGRTGAPLGPALPVLLRGKRMLKLPHNCTHLTR